MYWISRSILSVLTLVMYVSVLLGQADFRKANKFLEVQEYDNAINLYLKILDEDPSNLQTILQLANAYRLNNQLKFSEKKFKTAESIGELPAESNLHFGHVLMGLGQYEQALVQYSLYGREFEEFSRIYLEKCRFAIDHASDRADFTVKHEYLNTPKSDFGPTFFEDEIIYLSNRKDITAQSPISSDVDIELLKTKPDAQGFLESPKRIKSLTRPAFNVIALSYHLSSGQVAITRGGELNNANSTDKDNCTLYLGTFDKYGFFKDIKPFEFNLTGHSAGFASFSEDGNTMYFASDIPESRGGFDIFMSELVGGKWSAPISLEAGINTPGNEIYPRSIGDYMVFASDYHPGLGGYDIFKSSLSGDIPGPAQNMGTAINSASDDYDLVYNTDYDVGYLVSNRSGGKGLEDLYRISALDENYFQKQLTANREKSKLIVGDYTILKGMVVNSSDELPVENVEIAAHADGDNQIVTAFSNKKGLFSIPLIAGTYYNLSFQSNDFLNASRTIEMKDAKEMELLKVVMEIDHSIIVENSISAKPVALKMDHKELQTTDNSENNSADNWKSELFADAGTASVSNANKRIESSKEKLINSEPAFAVQIAAISKNVKSDRFAHLKDLGSLYTLFDSRVYKVRCGLYTTKKTAEKVLEEIRKRGYQSAFVVQETPSDVMDLVMLDLGVSGHRQSSVPVSKIKTEEKDDEKQMYSDYKVRLATYSNPKWFDSTKIRERELGFIEVLVNNGKSIYLLSGFENKNEASKALELAIEAGFPDAILVKDDEGNLIKVQ